MSAASAAVGSGCDASATGSAGFDSAGGGDGCAGASATGSTGFVSGVGDDCCDSPHPTRSTAAIVVSSSCFILLQLSILHPSCRRVCGGGRRFRHTLEKPNDSVLSITIL